MKKSNKVNTVEANAPVIETIESTPVTETPTPTVAPTQHTILGRPSDPNSARQKR
jgi:hypothetical protein